MLFKSLIKHFSRKTDDTDARDLDDISDPDVPNERSGQESEFEAMEEDKEEGERELSPRSIKFNEKFFLASDEYLVSYHMCAMKKGILLQGHLYLTNKKLCFFSPFNNVNIIFGKPTKLVIPYSQIDRLEKASVVGVIRNSIKVQLKNKKRIKFASFVRRSEIYHKLNELIEQCKEDEESHHVSIPDECVENESDGSSDDTLKKFNTKATINDEDEDSNKNSSCYNSDFMDTLDSLTMENEATLVTMEERLKPEFIEKFKIIMEETFDRVSLKEVYNKIYGDEPHIDGQTFLRCYVEKLENYDIEEELHSPNIPSYFKEEKDKRIYQYTPEELEEEFSDIKHTAYSLTYTHPLNMPFAPKSCKINELHDTYFVSPSKIVILTTITNSGVKFSDCFRPLILTTLKQKICPIRKTVSVTQTVSMYIHFIKTVRFFKGTIEKNTYASIEASYEEVFLPMVRACLGTDENPVHSLEDEY